MILARCDRCGSTAPVDDKHCRRLFLMDSGARIDAAQWKGDLCKDCVEVVVKLLKIKADAMPTRCQVFVKGEQCGEPFGHEGKHMWIRGD